MSTPPTLVAPPTTMPTMVSRLPKFAASRPPAPVATATAHHHHASGAAHHPQMATPTTTTTTTHGPPYQHGSSPRGSSSPKHNGSLLRIIPPFSLKWRREKEEGMTTSDDPSPPPPPPPQPIREVRKPAGGVGGSDGGVASAAGGKGRGFGFGFGWSVTSSSSSSSSNRTLPGPNKPGGAARAGTKPDQKAPSALQSPQALSKTRTNRNAAAGNRLGSNPRLPPPPPGSAQSSNNKPGSKQSDTGPSGSSSRPGSKPGSRPGSGGPGSRASSPLLPSSRSQSEVSLRSAPPAATPAPPPRSPAVRLSLDDRLRSQSLTQVRSNPSIAPHTTSLSRSSTTTSSSSRSYSFNRAAERGTRDSASSPLTARPPGRGGGATGGPGQDVDGQRSGVAGSAPSLLPSPAPVSASLRKSLLPGPAGSAPPSSKPAGSGGVPGGYRLSRPSLIRQPRPLRASAPPPQAGSAHNNNNKQGGGDLEVIPHPIGGGGRRRDSLDTPPVTPSTTDDSPGSTPEAPEAEGGLSAEPGSQGEVSVLGETLEDMSLSSTSSLERNDTSQEYMDDFDNLGNGGVGLLLLSSSNQDQEDSGLGQSGDRVDEDEDDIIINGVSKSTRLHSFLSDSLDWTAVNHTGNRGDIDMNRHSDRRRSSQPEHNGQGGWSLELSPSDSCGSGGTYLWDEEGLEPLGGAVLSASHHSANRSANHDTDTNTSHIGSYDSDLKSIDILNHLESCDLDDDDLMLDVDLPEDISLHSDTDGLPHMAQWSGPQLCWESQELCTDLSDLHYRLTESPGNQRTDSPRDEHLFLGGLPDRSPCLSPSTSLSPGTGTSLSPGTGTSLSPGTGTSLSPGTGGTSLGLSPGTATIVSSGTGTSVGLSLCTGTSLSPDTGTSLGLSPGTGPSVSSGTGPSLSSGTGTSVSSGTGPSLSSGTGPSGPSVSPGTGPSLSSGTGTSVCSGTGPSVSSGTGPSVSSGTGLSVSSGTGPSGPSVSSGTGPSGPSVSSGTGPSGPSVSSGTGLSVSSGTGLSVSSGTGLSVSSGTGLSVSSGTGPSVALGLEDVEELAEDCSAVREHLEHLQKILLQEEECDDDDDEETLTTEPQCTQIEELMQEVQRLREELRSRDRTIAQLTHTLSVATAPISCGCQDTERRDGHSQTSVTEREDLSLHKHTQTPQQHTGLSPSVPLISPPWQYQRSRPFRGRPRPPAPPHPGQHTSDTIALQSGSSEQTD